MEQSEEFHQHFNITIEKLSELAAVKGQRVCRTDPEYQIYC